MPEAPPPPGAGDPVNDVDPEEAGLAALEAAARVGPFFVLRPDPSDDGWMPFAAFAADVDRVAAAVDDARRRMAVAAGTSADSFEPRATASIWHLGIAARLVSPALGAAVLARWVPRLDNLLWSPETATGPDGLAIRAADIEGTPVADAAGAAAAIEAGVVGTAIRPITESVSALAAVSANVLWGNVWSAFAGAATVLAAGRPTAGRAAVDVVRMLVATTPHTLAGGYDSAGRFRRDTCCLYYRLPRGGLCGDCVLHRVPQAAVRSLDNSLVEAGAGRYP